MPGQANRPASIHKWKGTHLMGFLNKLFGSHSDRELKKIQPIVDKILALEEPYRQLDDEALKAKTGEFVCSRPHAYMMFMRMLPEMSGC